MPKVTQHNRQWSQSSNLGNLSQGPRLLAPMLFDPISGITWSFVFLVFRHLLFRTFSRLLNLLLQRENIFLCTEHCFLKDKLIFSTLTWINFLYIQLFSMLSFSEIELLATFLPYVNDLY